MMFDDLSPYYRHSISTIHTHFFQNGLEKENEFSKKKEIAKPYVSPSKGSENTLSEIILN